MKSYKSKTGPFAEQPYYESAEIETICSEELQKLNLLPSVPSPIRIDRFVEKRFNIQPTYEDLPNGLLGFTRFGDAGVVEIVVARALDEEGTVPAERRLRTTLAHEGGHGLLHAHLFVLGASPRSLFGYGLAPDAAKILCRDGGVPGIETGRRKPPYTWWEFQANQAMVALLLPKFLVERVAATILVPQGIFGLRTLPPDRRERAVQLVAETFNVNQIVARIRLENIYPPSAQLHL